MKKEKTTQFLMKPKVDFCFKELMEDEEVRNAFLQQYLGSIWKKSLRAGFCRPTCVRKTKMINGDSGCTGIAK